MRVETGAKYLMAEPGEGALVAVPEQTVAAVPEENGAAPPPATEKQAIGLNEMRDFAEDWSLRHDDLLLDYLSNWSKKLIDKTRTLENAVRCKS